MPLNGYLFILCITRVDRLSQTLPSQWVLSPLKILNVHLALLPNIDEIWEWGYPETLDGGTTGPEGWRCVEPTSVCVYRRHVSVLVGEQRKPEVLFMQIELICIPHMNVICTPPSVPNFALKQQGPQAKRRWGKPIMQSVSWKLKFAL